MHARLSSILNVAHRRCDGHMTALITEATSETVSRVAAPLIARGHGVHVGARDTPSLTDEARRVLERGSRGIPASVKDVGR